MATASGKAHEHWSGRFAFIMAAVGSSVGLGNFWRFPYMAGQNGGAAFVLVYLGCVVLVALPALLAEYALGRRAQLSGVGAVRALAAEAGASKYWVGFAWIGMLTSLMIVTFYSVVAGWVTAYIPLAFSGVFETMPAEELGSLFDALVGSVERQLLFHTVFLVLTVGIVMRGIRNGIEAATSYLMPAFFVMLLGIVVYAAIEGDFAAAATFLLTPDFSKVTFSTVQMALGQALFSVGVGSVLMMTYGAYLDRNTKLMGSAATVAGSDTLVAIVAGFAIFPLVFANGLEPAAGPGLFFQTLPVAFANLPFGSIVAGIFFSLALFAALTSSISLLETGVSWAEEQTGITRPFAALGIGFIIWMMGAGAIFSLGYLDFVDWITGSLLLPLGALLVTLFAGWAVKRQMLADEMAGESKVLFALWYLLIRFVTPLGVAVILVFGLWDKAHAWFPALFPAAAG